MTDPLDIRDIRVMRDWVIDNRVAPEGKQHTNHMPSYSQCVDIVQAEYPGGVRGFLDDRARREIVAALAAHERARAAWNARGRTTWEGAVDVGISQRDINAAAEDLRASRSWD